MRSAAQQANDLARLQAWAGQSAALAQASPAAEVVERLWSGAERILSG
jgi:nitronate monooxygenase